MKRTLIATILILVGVSLSAQNFSAMSKEQANDWVYYSVKYARFFCTVAEGQKPEVTLRTRSANCVGMALLLVDILDKYNICCAEIVLVSTPQGKHAIVMTSSGEYLDPTAGEAYEELPKGWKAL